MVNNFNVLDIVEVFHDGIIKKITGKVPGDITLEIECDYIRKEMDGTNTHFFMKLYNCTKFELLNSKGKLITDLDKIAKLDLWIQSVAERDDGGIRVFSTDGWFDIDCGSIQILDESGNRIKDKSIFDAATSYWEKFEKQGPESKSEKKKLRLPKELFLIVIVVLVPGIWLGYQLNDFLERAREKEATALLGGLYQAVQATKSVYDFYPQTFKNTGFAPVGALNYQLYYFSKGTSFKACAVPKNGGNWFLIDENKDLLQNAHIECAEVIINSEQDPENLIPKLPYGQ